MGQDLAVVGACAVSVWTLQTNHHRAGGSPVGVAHPRRRSVLPEVQWRGFLQLQAGLQPALLFCLVMFLFSYVSV